MGELDGRILARQLGRHIRLEYATGVCSHTGLSSLFSEPPHVEDSVADAAKKLGLSTGALPRLILSDDPLRQAVNEFRGSKGMKPLK